MFLAASSEQTALTSRALLPYTLPRSGDGCGSGGESGATSGGHGAVCVRVTECAVPAALSVDLTLFCL